MGQDKTDIAKPPLKWGRAGDAFISRKKWGASTSRTLSPVASGQVYLGYV